MITNKNAAIFISVLSSILFITGLIYGFNNTININDYLANLNSNNTAIISYIVIIILFFISTLSIFGIILESIYIGIESISIGYVLANFISYFKLKGLLYGLINIILNKGLFFLILIYLFINSIKYLKIFIYNLLGINKNYTSELIMPLIKKYLVLLIIISIYGILLYLFGNKFLNYLTFML